MMLFQSKSSRETEQLLKRFNQEVIEAHARVIKLGKIMRSIQAGDCPIFPCYVDRDGYLSLKRTAKIANGRY